MSVFARWFTIVALFRLLRARRRADRAEQNRLAGLAAIARGGAKR